MGPKDGETLHCQELHNAAARAHSTMAQPDSNNLHDDPWCTVGGKDSVPPEGETVWTTDGRTVRKGTWEEGNWHDVEGRLITVTRWMFADEDFEEPPGVPV